MKILCVEDDQGLAELLQVILVQQHYQFEVATDGIMAWELAETYPYDLILLDLVLPGLDGIRFCQKLRANNSPVPNPNRDTPILLMTALDEVTNKVMGLDAGADDYVVKPFIVEELLARIRALLRRNKVTRSPILTYDDLALNPNSCQVTYKTNPVPLTSKEYQLLELFLRNPDQIFNPTRLLDRLWTAEECPSEGAIRSHIKSLRKKLKQMGSKDIVETIYKLGYRLKRREEKEDFPQATTDSTISSIPATVAPGLGEVWLECRQSYVARLTIIKDVTRYLEENRLTSVQQQEAEIEAHTLTGSLGSFGLEEASAIARQIQQVLKQKKKLGLADLEKLKQLLPLLEHHLEHSKTTDLPPLPIVFPYTSFGTSPPFLLIIDDDAIFAKALAEEARTWGFEVEIANNLEQSQTILNSRFPQVVIIDLNFSDDNEKGVGFLAAINRQNPTLPIVILTVEDNFAKRLEAARLGSQCFLPKPITPPEVLAIVSQVMQTSNLSTARLLVVDDDPDLLRLLHTLLEPFGYQLTMLQNPQEFWKTLEQTTPDLLILDIRLGAALPVLEENRAIVADSPPQEIKATDLPESVSQALTEKPLSGIDLCKVIRSDPRWNRLPIIFLSGHTDIETIQTSFDAGADDFLSKPIIVTELLNRIRIRLEQRKLWSMSEIDELTGVSLRRKALQDLTRLFHLAKRQQQPLSLAILDLDYFKRINDDYGHDTGDRVLRYFGQLLGQTFRQEDVVGRWGGEEFVVGLYGTNKQQGVQRLENIAYYFSQNHFVGGDGSIFQMTFSGGIAQFPDDGDDLQSLYRAADTALYRAKYEGRNQIYPVIEEDLKRENSNGRT